MRNFILYNQDKTRIFNFEANGIIVANPKGLGNKFKMSYLENDKYKYVTNIKPDFENISFDYYFNVNGRNGYVSFKNLLTFIKNSRLELILEYDDTITKKLCKVNPINLPKGDIDENNIFMEKFIFERQTYWYKEDNLLFTLTSSTNGNANTYPLTFPFGFVGDIFRKEATITNDFFEDAAVEIKISGSIEDNIELYLDDLKGNRIIEIKLLINCRDGREILITSIEKRKVLITENGITKNGYDLIDRRGQSFIEVPPGSYVIGSNIKITDRGRIDISILNYLLD